MDAGGEVPERLMEDLKLQVKRLMDARVRLGQGLIRRGSVCARVPKLRPRP